MLLDAVIIVLRETLEAGVLVSLLLSIASRLQLGSRWLWLALAAGLVGAAAYAASLGTVSTWFDYVGQEVINAGMQYSIYACMLVISLLLASPMHANHRHLGIFLILTVALALAREGSEIAVFLLGYSHDRDLLDKALTGGFVGLMLGLSVGALTYYAIVSLPPGGEFRVQQILLALIAAGMVEQATQLLVQADWLPAAMPLWDSSELLSERSVAGEIAYAIFGYEATPTPVEACLYVVALVLVPVSIVLHRRLVVPGPKAARPV